MREKTARGGVALLEAIVVIVSAFVWVVFSFSLGGACADLASEKGYNWGKAFWICFFLGITGCFLVAAWPDQKLRKRAELAQANGDTQG